jgi:hypothetical protein
VLALVLVVALGMLRLRDQSPALQFVIPGIGAASPTPQGLSWQEVSSSSFTDVTTPLPTPDLPTAQYVAPTLPPAEPVIVPKHDPTQLFGRWFRPIRPCRRRPADPIPSRCGGYADRAVQVINGLPTK